MTTKTLEDAAIAALENAYHDRNACIVPHWAMEELRAALEGMGVIAADNPPADALFEGK